MLSLPQNFPIKKRTMVEEEFEKLKKLRMKVAMFGLSWWDSKPLLLHLKDPRAGAIAVIGDARPLFDFIIRSSSSINSDILIVVLTSNPDGWKDNPAIIVCDSSEILPRMISTCLNRTDSSKPTLLLIDGIEVVMDSLDRINFLCKHGPVGMVWPILAEEKKYVPAGFLNTVYQIKMSETSRPMYELNGLKFYIPE